MRLTVGFLCFLCSDLTVVLLSVRLVGPGLGTSLSHLCGVLDLPHATQPLRMGRPHSNDLHPYPFAVPLC